MWGKTSESLGRISRAFLSLVTELWTGTVGQGELLWLGKVWVPSSHLRSNGEDGWRSVHLAVLDPFYLFGPSEEVNGCRPVCFVGDTPFSGRQCCSHRQPAGCPAVGCTFQAQTGTAPAAALVHPAVLGTDAYGKWRSEKTANRKCPGACLHILKVGGNLQTANRMAQKRFHSFESC